MGKQKFRCRQCGAILVGGHARREHCQIHHPGTPFGKLDIFFRGEYEEVNGDISELAEIPSTPKYTVKKDSRGNVTYTLKTTSNTSPKNEPKIDCSRIVPRDIPYRPKSSRVEDLFEYAVKKIAEFSQGNSSFLEAKMSNQWMNICFGYPGIKTHERQDYIARVKDTYRAYFKRGAGSKYSFDFEQILRDFPEFFKGGESRTVTKVSISTLIEDIKTEIYLTQSPQNRLKYRVDKIERIDPTKHLYQFHLDLGDDDMPSFYEGISIKLRISDSQFYDCEGIDYDMDEEVLIVRSSRSIFGSKGTIYLDTSFILKALRSKLELLLSSGFTGGQPGTKFIPDNTRFISPIPNAPSAYLPIIQNMDESQRRAHDAAIGKDITFIWGPPGTGKSFTLAGLINTFFQNNSTTLVCCISNVAVDQLLNKVIDVVESLGLKPRPGQLLRSGHTIDSRLMKKDYLFPSDTETKRIRQQISDLTSKISSPGYTNDAKTLFKERRIDLRDALKKRTETLIGGSSIVFSTIANYVLSTRLEEKKFDNLIVDEASMLSLPYLMAIAGKIAKRIVLVGDPNQLGPIALCTRKSLTDSIFDYCNVFSDKGIHPALCQLLTQRRSHSAIVSLTNTTFYEGRLLSVINESPEWVLSGPFPNKIVKVINNGIDDDETKMWGSSRRNYGTFNKVIELIEKYYQFWKRTGEDISIGIITPYRAQVKMYYGRIRQLYGSSHFFKHIKIGTIHTFQGSECDLIFLDLVEKSPTQVSRLMNQKYGERLITVALSRARHKMIVVGDTLRFQYSTGINLVSNKVCAVLKNLRDK